MTSQEYGNMKKTRKFQIGTFINVILLIISFTILLRVVIYTQNNIVNISTKPMYSLDTDYIDALNSAESNIEKVNINTHFCNLWIENANFYYNKILMYFKDNAPNLYQETLQDQLTWENYYIQQKNYYNNLLISIYGSGTILPIKLSAFECEQNRQRALALYHRCLELSIEVEPPDKELAQGTVSVKTSVTNQGTVRNHWGQSGDGSVIES